MPHVVTTKSVVISTPVLDTKGKPVTDEIKWNGRKTIIELYDHIQHDAGTVLKLDDVDFAKKLVEDGHARDHLSGLDDEVDPTKPSGDDALA